MQKNPEISLKSLCFHAHRRFPEGIVAAGAPTSVLAYSSRLQGTSDVVKQIRAKGLLDFRPAFDEWYQKAPLLDRDPDRLRSSLCLYGHLVEAKLHARKRACQFQMEHWGFLDFDFPKRYPFEPEVTLDRGTYLASYWGAKPWLQ